MTWLLPVAISDDARFRACVRANVCAWLLVMPWWMLIPTTLPRPALPAGMWQDSFRWLWAIDQPNNVMPCAHGVGPVVAAWFASQTYTAWRWPLIIFLVPGLSSIALVWQHRPIDIFLGIVAAIAGILFAEIWKSWSQRRSEQQNPLPSRS